MWLFFTDSCMGRSVAVCWIRQNFPEGGTSVQQEGSETMKQDYTPLDQDTLTRLVYTHDDEITELTQKLLLLIDRIEQVESELNGEI